MTLKFSPWIVWPIWLLWCAFLSWHFTRNIGAAAITFVFLTVPLLLWVKRQTKKRRQTEEQADE